MAGYWPSSVFVLILCILINVDVNLRHTVLQHCYFKDSLFHYKTLLVHDSSIGSSEALSDRTSASV